MMQTNITVDLSVHMEEDNQNQQTYEMSAEAEDFDPNQVIQNGQEEDVYVMLYQAAKKCNWRDAKDILRKNQRTIGRSITESRESVLHIAFASKHMAFIKEVVRILTDEDLERTNVDGDTALCFAAKLGVVTIAKELVEKNKRLPLIRSSEGRTPLCIAVLFGHRHMASYLCTMTSFEGLSPNENTEILVAAITYDMYDIALYLLKTNATIVWYENNTAAALIIKKQNIAAALLELARKPFAIGSKSQLILWKLWKRCLNFCQFDSNPHFLLGIGSPGILDKPVMQALVVELVLKNLKLDEQFKAKKFSYIIVRNLLFDAAKFGNAEFINKLIRTYPHIVWASDDFHRSLFHIAVIHRQESVFNLIYEIFVVKEVILTYVDAYKQNILHLAGKLAPPNRLNLVPGAALQMHLEILWFKKVEKIVPPSYLKMKNSNNLTPCELFTKEHENLRVEAEKWVNDSVNFYIVAATLITGVAFTAAFTVPGGSNPDTGSPILLKSVWFRVFFISDAIALLSSSTSMVLFLSILSSHFKEIDFLVPSDSLTSKFALGVRTLSYSIAGMLVAFAATCFLVFNSEMTWLPIVIIALASIPIIIYSELISSLNILA